MSKIISFLNELDDYELAFLARFKLPTYMEHTQFKIKKYLGERGLTEAENPI